MLLLNIKVTYHGKYIRRGIKWNVKIKRPSYCALSSDQTSLNPIQDGLFTGYSRMGEGGGVGKKVPLFLKSVTHILQWWNLAQLYFTKEDQKNVWITWRTGNQQILLYQQIQINIAFWYIISNSFNFYWVLKDFFNKHSYNFDDVSKDGYPRLL